jgi:hypothetical protein
VVGVVRHPAPPGATQRKCRNEVSFPLDFLAPAALMVESNAGIALATIFGNWENHHEQEMHRMSSRPQRLGRRAGRTGAMPFVLRSGRQIGRT